MEEIIEGCFKIFFGPFAILAVPVIVLIYALAALSWCLRELHQLWLQCWPYVFGSGAAILAIAIGAALAIRWWEIHQVKRQRQKALRNLDRMCQQTVKQMDELGQRALGGAP